MLDRTVISSRGAPRLRRRVSNTDLSNPGSYIALAIVLGTVLTNPVATNASTSPALGQAIVVWQGKGGTPLSGPTGVAVDVRHGEIVVANTAAHRIEFFDLSGRPLGALVHRVAEPRGAYVEGQPRTLALDRAGHLLVSDNLASYVDVLDFFGRSITRLRPFEGQPGAGGPGALAVDAAGTIYVASSGDSGRIVRYSPEYEPLPGWGLPGREAGQLCQITGLAFAPDGRAVVTCVGTQFGIQVFDASGRYVTGFGLHELGPENISFPSGVAVTGDGRIWITDATRQTVQVYDLTGRYLGTCGQGGDAPGDFYFPSAVASDGADLLAIAERVGSRLQLFRVR